MISTARQIALLSAAALVLAAGCHHAAAVQPEALPPLRTAQLSPPTSGSSGAIAPATMSTVGAPLVAGDTAREVHLQIDTHGKDEDVRRLLDFVAKEGGFTLVYPADLDRRVRVSMNDVPASVALQTLLSLGGLTLETTTPGARRPSAPSVVFYELPVNVDSLSAEAMMKRFGIGRSIAELLVQARSRP